MNQSQRKKAEVILNGLTYQKFADWYNTGRFDSWLEGEFPSSDITYEDVLEDIVNLFKL